MRRCVFLAILLVLFASGSVAGGDAERIEGVVTAVHQNDFVLEHDGKQIVVDMTSLGGVTAAIAQGQPVAVIGTIAPDGQRFIATRLEPAPRRSRTSGQP